MKGPISFRSRSSGRWRPSNMPASSPGPSRTVSGMPTLFTGSPAARPRVSSYTWTTALSRSIRTTSPVGPDMPRILPVAMVLSSFRPSSELQSHMISDGPPDEPRRIIFRFRRGPLRRGEDEEYPVPSVLHFPEPVLGHLVHQTLVDDDQPRVGVRHDVAQLFLHPAGVHGVLRNAGEGEAVCRVMRSYEGDFFHTDSLPQSSQRQRKNQRH